MEESNHSDAESLLKGVNLQAVITACQAQRQDMIPQDLIQKIEKVLRKEINNDTTTPTRTRHPNSPRSRTKVQSYGALKTGKEDKHRGSKKCGCSSYQL